MAGLARWFPSYCSRLRVFVCYAHEDHAVAEEIAQALTNDGHDVFIDARKLKVSGDFNEDIRHAIEQADRFIFLISRASTARGKYPQTELGFAQERWPAPQGAVWPVLIDPDVDVAQLPIYLRSVQIMRVRGNAPAEVAAEIERSRIVRPAVIGGTVGALAVLATFAGIYFSGGLTPANFTLVPPQQVDFRPSKKPDPGDGWPDSWLAVTLIPVQYSNDGGTAVRIQNETVTLSLPIKGKPVAFRWYNRVELAEACADWLCTKGSIGVQTLPSKDTLSRDTMFAPEHTDAVSWREFLGAICSSTADRLDVSISATVSVTGITGQSSQSRTATCTADLKKMRDHVRMLGCAAGAMTRMPLRLSPPCITS